jgi:hypothetical protein
VVKEKDKFFTRFLDLYGKNHKEVMYVGMGMSYGRSRFPFIFRINRIDQNYRRFLIDGYSFFRVAVVHKFISATSYPFWLKESDRQSFDYGVGRCTWFVESGKTKNIVSQINALEESRQKNAWHGLGVSLAYAGKASETAIRELKNSSGSYTQDLVCGSQTAYEMRSRAENPAKHTKLAYEVLKSNTGAIPNLADGRILDFNR